MRRHKVVIYEPFGNGGICHYTFQLSQGLSKIGVGVTLLTRETYELENFKRNFKIYNSDKVSRISDKVSKIYRYIKNIIIYISRFAPNKKIINIESNSLALNSPVLSNNNSRINIISSRQIVLWAEMIAIFLRERSWNIHIQWVLEPERDLLFMRIIRALGFKIIYTAHNLLPHDNETAQEYKKYLDIYNSVDRIIVHAENNKRELIDKFGINSGKIFVIPHGVYDIFLCNENIGIEAARTELGISKSRKVILFFGAIRRYKGFEYLAEAFLKAKEKIDDLELLIVGKVGDIDSNNRTFYLNLIKQLSLRNDVHCVEEYVTMENVGKYFTASDLVVLPYVKTYQSGVLLLAYAYGKPVVVTDTGGMGEIVEDDKSGYVVPPEDVQSMTEAIIKVFACPGRSQTMGSYAKELGRNRYAWDLIAEKTLEVYKSLD
jgi:D-inositol-3-phosphate glycosyltransferase